MIFTQYLFPNGRRKENEIAMPPDIEQMALEVEKAGWRFEIEVFPDTQIVHMDCCNEDRTLSNRLCKNGPDVPKMVEELVREAYENRDKPEEVES